MKKRALSLLMALIMVVSLLPTAVWAAGETDDWGTVDSPETFAAMTADGKYKLTKDITVSAPYASNFTGTFDGDGHTITVTIKGNGLFATTNGATIQNLKVDGSVTGSSANVGGIVGNVISGKTAITNCSFSGSVTSSKSSSAAGVGGIVGKVTSGTLTVTSCANHATVTATNGCPGGIVGYGGSTKSTITVKNCYNDGTISGKWYPSGICAYNTSKSSNITNCYNAGTVSGGTNYAGISAYYTGTASDCYRTEPDKETFYSSSTTTYDKGASTNLHGKTSTEIADALKSLGFSVSNDGKVYLPWEGGEVAEKHPRISISGSNTLQMVNNGPQDTTTLNVAYTDIDNKEPVVWSVDKSDIVKVSYPENPDANNTKVILQAVNPGTVKVTATAGEYTDEYTVAVYPFVTTVEIAGKVAIGETVSAKVSVLGGGEYKYDEYPKLTYAWQYITAEDYSAGNTGYSYYHQIQGATGREFTIPDDMVGDYLFVYVTFNGNHYDPGRPTKIADTDQAIVDKDASALYEQFTDLVIKAPENPVTLDLKTSGDNGSTISWSSDNEAVINPQSGVVTLPSEGIATVKLTAELTHGSVTITRTYTITVWSQAAVESEANDKVLQLNNAIDAAKLNTLYPTYGKDTNVLTMVETKLNNSDISVSIKGVEKTNATDNSSNIADNGDVTFFYANPNNAPLQRFGTYSVTFTFTRDGITVERTIPVVVYWDQTKVKSAMTAEILDKVTVDEKNTVTEDFDLPKVVDGKKWTLISWQSDDPAITISTKKQTTADTLFDPYVAVVRGGSAEKKVTLTANFTFQLANSSDETSALTLHKTFTVNVAPSADGEKYQDALNTVFDDDSLKDITGDGITSADGVYSVSGDIQFPITGDLNRYMLDKYGEGSGFDGKYTPVLITSSDPDVIKAPDVANAARVEVYRPAPNQSAKTVTLTVRILDRPSGQGRDYANMPVLAEKTFTFQVQPITTEEVRAELDLMQQVKEHYWDGIKNGNAYPQDVTSDLDPFVEVYQQDGKLVWVRDVKQMTNSGIVPVAMDGWQELEAWRLFQSSNPTAVSHENLLVTRQFEGKAVTITSALSSETLGRYGQLYLSDTTKYADYASLADLYYQTVSANLIVRGYNEANMTEETVTGADGKSETIKVSTPKSETISVTFTLSGNGALWMDTTTLSDLPEGTTVYDVLQQLQREGKLTFQHKGGYVSSITFGDKTLTELEEGENSGWMYRVNGVLPDVYMSAYGLKNGDNIRVFFTTDYTKESGGHGGSAPSTVPTTPEQPTGLPFTDVQAGAWYADAVKYVFDQGLMSGMSAQEFGPDGQVTRGQVVTILWRLAGSPTVSGKAFHDVSAADWYADAVAWASANGVVSGYENGGFGPEDQVTREQLAAILYRYAQLSGKDTGKSADLSGYTDSVTISAWAPQALKWAVGSGLISGTGTHTLSPRGTATRAQIAVILQNYCK